MRLGYEATVIDARRDLLLQTGRLVTTEGKDEFYAKMLEEMVEV